MVVQESDIPNILREPITRSNAGADQLVVRRFWESGICIKSSCDGREFPVIICRTVAL